MVHCCGYCGGRLVNVLARLITTVDITLSLLCGVQKRQSPLCEIWEVIAANLSKSG
jgi:hypothetical protein